MWEGPQCGSGLGVGVASVWEGPQCLGALEEWTRCGCGLMWEGLQQEWGLSVGGASVQGWGLHMRGASVWEGPQCVRRALLWGRSLSVVEELHVWEGTGAQEQPQWGEELPVWEGLSAWVEPNLLAGLSRCSLWGYPVMFPSSFWAHHKTISQPFVLWGHVTESWPMEYGINDACHSQAWS